MSGAIRRPERRKDRSPYADEAVGKFLAAVRRDNRLDALLVVDGGGYLVAASAQGFSESSLEALAAFGAELGTRVTESADVEPVQVFLSEDDGGEAKVRVHVLGDLGLTLVLVGEGGVSEDQRERIRAGVQRILELNTRPGGR